MKKKFQSPGIFVYSPLCSAGVAVQQHFVDVDLFVKQTEYSEAVPTGVAIRLLPGEGA
ncbi:hypothetical protein LOC54_06765 [Acetobacter sp. AN02]|uniref:hypothetical protein n=1 Tax=Acetobacter sp. AN02 TaxID=2894186 RepID=UPI0024342723|nr:hypothetical protein [Acetobacter sp. AN02]MDG6094812.1 hypothetical protein [Acetobacter sp. AN02]